MILQESNLATRQPRILPHNVIQATMTKGLAHGPYVTARVVFEPATFRTEGTEHHHWATSPNIVTDKVIVIFALRCAEFKRKYIVYVLSVYVWI